MKLVVLAIIILIKSGVLSISFQDTTIFLKEYLIYRNARVVYSFTCFSNTENLKLFKIVNDLNIALSFSKMDTNIEVFAYNEINFIIDLYCDNSISVLRKAGKWNLYQSHYKWLFLDFRNRFFTNNSLSHAEIADIPIRIDSDILVATKIIFQNYDFTSIKLTDLYKLNSNYTDTLRLDDVLIWREGETMRTKISKYNQRKNMTNVPLKAAIVCLFMEILKSTSIDYYYRHVNTKNFDTINKVNFNLFLHIQEIHNFTLQLLVVDKWFGNELHGIDDGLAKVLYENIVDVAATSGRLLPDRLETTHFVSPTITFKTAFLFLNSETSNNIGNKFLKPFSLSVWYYILGFVVLFWIAFGCILLIADPRVNCDINNSWFSTYLLIWAVLCQQGATFVPKPVSGRFTLFSLLVMSLLIYNYYTSSIVSSLLSGLPPPISTIEELAASNLDVALEDTPYVRTLFETSNESSIINLYHSKVLNKNNQLKFLTTEEGIIKVKHGGFAYQTDVGTGYSIIETEFEPHEICKLAEINLFTPSTLWVMTQKRSQYKEFFAVGYLKMLQSGITLRQQSIWITKKPTCFANTQLVKVGMPDLLPAFFILSLGGVASIILLSIELLLVKNKFTNVLVVKLMPIK